MTADLEFKGRNVDKAVELAAKKLRIPVDDLDYEILSHGSTGIFGLAGVKKARIRVTKPAGGNEDRRGAMQVSMDAPASGVEENEGRKAEHTADAAQTVGESVLRRMVDAISPEARIDVHKDEKRLRFEVVGGQAGILIGKRGQTLDAMQLLVEKAVRRVDGHDLRLEVDVEGYLAKRRAGLEHMAERLAKKVAAKGIPSSAGYMNAHDRRVVHLALKEFPGVRTKSVGDGALRKLMIYPRRKSQARH